MITIGAVYGGPELRNGLIDQAIRRTSKATPYFSKDFEIGSSPAVNVVFHVPGSMFGPDWEWLRDAKFSRRDQMLMVQVAVPEEVVKSSSPEDFIIDSLHGANAVAFEFFRQKGMEFPLADAEQLVDVIKSKITAK